MDLVVLPAADFSEDVTQGERVSWLLVLAEVERRRLTPAQVARVIDFLDRTFPCGPLAIAPGVARLLDEDRVVRGVRVAGVDDAIDVAAARLSPPAEAFSLARELRQREAANPSTVGGGLLVPHTDQGPPGACLLLLAAPVACPTPDGEPLRAVLALTGVPAGRAGLSLLGRAARVGDPELLDQVAAAADPREAIRLVELFEGAG